VRGDIIASDLRSIAHDVGQRWKEGADLRNAQRMERMNAQVREEKNQ
jgi:hypothetical protein